MPDETQFSHDEQVMKSPVRASDGKLRRVQLAKLMYLPNYFGHQYLGAALPSSSLNRR